VEQEDLLGIKTEFLKAALQHLKRQRPESAAQKGAEVLCAQIKFKDGTRVQGK
jgi:hypothetical protein